jgi:hypothetical protein
VEGIPQPPLVEGYPRCDGPPLLCSNTAAKTTSSTAEANQAHQPQTGAEHDSRFIFFERPWNAAEYPSHHSLGWHVGGDDPDGEIFAKLRYLLDKRFRRKYGIPLTAIWVRERHRNKRTQQQSEVVHSHLLLHLPSRRREPVRRDVEQLVSLVARQILDDRTIELTFPADPDGKYVLKGGTPEVWEAFGLPDRWRSRLGEGVIEGKRCGVTQNIGPAARNRRLRRQHEEVVA